MSSMFAICADIVLRMSFMRCTGVRLSESEYVLYRESCEFMASQVKMARILQDQEIKKLENDTTE